MKKISSFILTSMILLFTAGACSGDSGANTIFAPIAGTLGLGSTNNAFSNDLNDPVNLPGDVVVTQPPQANAGSAPLRGIIALERARLGRASRIDADVSVLTSGESHRELVLHRFARMEANRKARADSIRLHKRASILGTAEYNDIKLGKHASVADQVTPLADLPLLPPFLTGTPGSQSIDHGDSPLAAGNYGKLKLKKKKTLVLTGGIYHFTDVRLSRRSSLICETTCVLLVKNRLRAGRRVQLSAMSGKSSDLIIYVEGESHPHASVHLRKRTNTTADIYAPNGKVRVGRHANYTGNLIGRRVVIARRAQVVTGETVPPRVARLFRAGEAGTIEIPGEIRLEVPACALSDDTVISIAEKPVADAPPLPVGNIVSARAYDLQPDGLEFNCDVALTQKYDPDLVSDAGLDEDDLRLLIASGESPFLPVPTTVDASEDQVRGIIRHFSISLVGGIPGGTQATDLEFDGDIVALVYWGQPLQIINVQDKANPVLLPNPAGTPIPTSVEVAGNYVYVAGGFGQLFTIDVSGAVPVIVAQTANSTWTAMDMRVDGNYLYAASAAGSLRVADISNPAAPVIIPGAERALPGFVRAVDVSGSYAFVAHEISIPCPPCGLTVFDISDPLNPVQTTTTTLGLTGSTRLVNIKAEGNRVYLNARIFEFTAPATLSIVGNGPGRYYEAMGDTLFTDVSGTFTVYDAADPAALNVLDTFPTTFAGALRVDSNYAYVGTFTGFEILDMGDLTAGPNCTFLPATWIMGSGAQTITYSCTSNGLTYTCADDAGTLPTVEYVYPSATAAKLGLIDAPLVANFPSGGYRGSAIRLPSLGFSIDYTLDGMNRLATVMEASSGTNSTFGNYDANGYPQTLTGAITSGTYTYTYGAGSTPSQIQAVVNGANSTLNYSGRFMTAWNINDGFTTGTASRSGSVLVCQPPGPPPAPTVTPIPPIATNSYSSRPVNACWNGTRYLVTWQGMPFTTPARGRFLDAGGNQLGAEFNVTTSGHVGAFYSLACTTNRFALAWSKTFPGGGGRFAPFVQMLDSAGGMVGGEIQVSTPPAGQDAHSGLHIGTNGTNFYLAWEEYPDISNVTVRGLLLDGNGGPLTAVTNFTSPKFFLGGLNIASDGTNFLATYADFNTGLFSRRIDGAGTPVGGPIQLRAQGAAVGPSVWNGSFYLNTTVRGVDIISQVINADGTLGISETLTGIAPGSPWLAWNGSDFLMVFVNFVNSPDFEIMGQRYNASGQLVGMPFIIASGPGNRRNVRVASNGGTFLVTWDNQTTRTIEGAIVALP